MSSHKFTLAAGKETTERAYGTYLYLRAATGRVRFSVLMADGSIREADIVKGEQKKWPGEVIVGFTARDESGAANTVEAVVSDGVYTPPMNAEGLTLTTSELAPNGYKCENTLSIAGGPGTTIVAPAGARSVLIQSTEASGGESFQIKDAAGNVGYIFAPGASLPFDVGAGTSIVLQKVGPGSNPTARVTWLTRT